MSLSILLLALRGRYKVVLNTLLVIIASTIAVSLLLPKTYSATATVVLNYKGSDPVSGLSFAPQLMPGYIATQMDIIASKNVALKVVDQLRLAESPAVQAEFNDKTGGQGSIRDWVAVMLIEKMEVVPSRESGVIGIKVKDADPQFAAAVANAFATQYQITTIQLKTEPLRNASAYFDEQIKALRDKLRAAQNSLSRYQQEKGIVNVDSRLDVESIRLNDLSAQLVAVQGQLVEATSRQQKAQGTLSDNSPDIAANPLIQNLKASLVKAEANLSRVAQRFEKEHPQYLDAKAEVDQLRASLNSNIGSASKSLGITVRIMEQRVSELRSALAEQKAKVLELNRDRDTLAVLSKEVESAQRAYDTTVERFNQTSLEGKANQSDVALLTSAVAPSIPSSPNIVLNTVMSVFLGTILGIGIALLIELLDRRIRSVNDLVEATGAPVLGVVEWGRPKRIGYSGLDSAFPRRLFSN